MPLTDKVNATFLYLHHCNLKIKGLKCVVTMVTSQSACECVTIFITDIHLFVIMKYIVHFSS